jgi:hypothetical protein
LDDFYSLQLDKLERFVCLKESEVVPDLANPNADDSDEDNSEGDDESGDDDDDEDDEIDDEMGHEHVSASDRREDEDDEWVSRALPLWTENISKRHLVGRGAGRNEEEGTSIPFCDEDAAAARKGERQEIQSRDHASGNFRATKPRIRSDTGGRSAIHTTAV